MKWFEVDKQGLAKLLERRGKQFAIYELVQNAWDENTTRVDVFLKKEGRHVNIFVEDDNPTGFADLSHAFTLFADSTKKGDAEKRGRFNLGEKLVLALCTTAQISTTTGSIIFDEKGRHNSRAKRERGSQFAGAMKMTNDEFDACGAAVKLLIPPPGIATYFNGELIPTRDCVGTVSDSLTTEIADVDGILRRSIRATTVDIYEPADGEVAMLYEMGIPVVETGDRYHVNVGQKVPLNFDRDNVTPAYLAKVRALVAETMRRELTADDANSTWVKHALDQNPDDFSDETVATLARLRFGDKRVAYDPSDPEANALAVTQGYTVVHGGAMSAGEWEAMKRANAIRPAGQVTPSPKPFSPDGDELKMLPEDKWTPGIRQFKKLAHALALRCLDTAIDVEIANDFGWNFAGCYGGRRLIVNVAHCGGYKWFDGPLAPILEFIIHEFGHHYAGNHLSSEYYDALCRIAGKVAQVALDERRLFARAQPAEVEPCDA